MRKDQNLSLISFCFSPLWVSHNDIMSIVVEAWIVPVTSSPFYIWEEKLHRTKRGLKKWVKTLETPSLKKEKVMMMLEAHQIAMESKFIPEEDQNKEIKIQPELFDACIQEVALGRLKSRCLWLKT